MTNTILISMVGAQVLRQLSFFNCLGKGAGEYAPFDGEWLFSMAPAPAFACPTTLPQVGGGVTIAVRAGLKIPSLRKAYSAKVRVPLWRRPVSRGGDGESSPARPVSPQLRMTGVESMTVPSTGGPEGLYAWEF